MANTDSSHILISYNLHDFLEYQDINNILPPNLTSFCSEFGGDLIIRDSLLKQTDSIISNFLSGKNPNDIVFKNLLVEYLNKVSFKNYDTCLEMLRKLNYSNKEHFETLAFEIVSRAMTDTIVIKGIDLPDGQRTMSDLYADIALEFSNLLIKLNPKSDEQEQPKDCPEDIKFSTVLLDMCRKYFSDFTDVNKPLDQNNQYRVDNFKGFLNFIGLLFNRNIVTHNITLSCLSKLKELIFNKTWGQDECENVYSGYIKLMKQLLAIAEKKVDCIVTIELSYINRIKGVHSDIKVKNDITSKLRKFSMMSHKSMTERLDKVINVISV